MQMASCARASVGSSLSGRGTGPFCGAQSLVSSPSFKVQASGKPSKFNPLCRCAAERNPSSSNRRSPSFDLCFRQVSQNTKSSIRSSLCHAIDGNSTSSSNSTTADANPPSPPADKEQEGDNVVEYEEPETVGKALNQIRKERLASGEESPSKTEEFWRGVLEEIQLIEWPSLQKVLGTTGVVTGIIIGSSLVLLTVNALLAQLSDAFFNNAPPA